MKSKTRQSSKSTPKARPKVQRVPKAKAQAKPTEAPPIAGALTLDSDAFGVGHRPAHTLRPQDAALFRAFQSNLLSLISHELRTPLTGIMNALNLLESGESIGEFSADELVKMARQNAQRLHQSLVMVLDVAAMESGTFHAKLREIDLSRLARGRSDALRSLFADRALTLNLQHNSETNSPLLGDPQKIGRAIDLLFQGLIPRSTGVLKVRISSIALHVEAELASGMEQLWDAAWSQSMAGFQSGVSSPTSLFANVLQSEEAFLTRMEEGLGSELILIHEIMRLHQGSLTASRSGAQVSIELKFPQLSSEQGLTAVLLSRAYQISTELGSVALVLMEVPAGMTLHELSGEVKKSLFRASDAVYSLPERNQLALVLDDCKPEDAPRLLQRIQKTLEKELAFGIAHCPADGVDPGALLALAERRLPGG